MEGAEMVAKLLPLSLAQLTQVAVAVVLGLMLEAVVLVAQALS
jgi:hypothetical protein